MYRCSWTGWFWFGSWGLIGWWNGEKHCTKRVKTRPPQHANRACERQRMWKAQEKKRKKKKKEENEGENAWRCGGTTRHTAALSGGRKSVFPYLCFCQWRCCSTLAHCMSCFYETKKKENNSNSSNITDRNSSCHAKRGGGLRTLLLPHSFLHSAGRISTEGDSLSAQRARPHWADETTLPETEKEEKKKKHCRSSNPSLKSVFCILDVLFCFLYDGVAYYRATSSKR